jgi:hypothetical protein
MLNPAHLEPTGQTSHQNTGADQQHQTEHTPNKAINGVVHLRNHFQNRFLLALARFSQIKQGSCKPHDPSKSKRPETGQLCPFA